VQRAPLPLQAACRGCAPRGSAASSPAASLQTQQALGAAGCSPHLPLPPPHLRLSVARLPTLLAVAAMQVIGLCEKPRDPPLQYIVADTPGQIEVRVWEGLLGA
jgi:hypothetical protein